MQFCVVLRRKKEKKERKNMLHLESIYFTKGWKIAVPRNSTEDKKKKKEGKIRDTLGEEKLPV